jgi:hypothetical protein
MAKLLLNNLLGLGLGVFVVTALYGFLPVWPDNVYASELFKARITRFQSGGGT